jgi:hypothetical protein
LIEAALARPRRHAAEQRERPDEADAEQLTSGHSIIVAVRFVRFPLEDLRALP